MPRHWLLVTGVTAATLWAAAGALAQGTALRIALDLDNDPATGCTVELADPTDPSETMSFAGVELTVEVGLDGNADPPATESPQLVSCPPISGTPTTTALFTAPDVAPDAGYKGSDAVPVRIPVELLGYPDVLRVAIEATSSNGSSDLLFESAGEPITVNASASAVPGPGSLGGLALALLVLLAGLRHARATAARFACLAVAALLAAAGLHVDTAHGSTGWITAFTGLDPIATDAEGDSKDGDVTTDLMAFFATRSGEDILLRVDVASVEFPRCRENDAYTDRDCDGICQPADEPMSHDCSPIGIIDALPSEPETLVGALLALTWASNSGGLPETAGNLFYDNTGAPQGATASTELENGDSLARASIDTSQNFIQAELEQAVGASGASVNALQLPSSGTLQASGTVPAQAAIAVEVFTTAAVAAPYDPTDVDDYVIGDITWTRHHDGSEEVVIRRRVLNEQTLESDPAAGYVVVSTSSGALDFGMLAFRVDSILAQFNDVYDVGFYRTTARSSKFQNGDPDTSTVSALARANFGTP